MVSHIWRYEWQADEIRFLRSSGTCGISEPTFTPVAGWATPQTCNCSRAGYEPNLLAGHYWVERMRDYDGTGFPDYWIANQRCMTCGVSHVAFSHEGDYDELQDKIIRLGRNVEDQFMCCPDHPDAKHILTQADIRHPDIMDFPETWWVWSCQHMSTFMEGGIKMRCGYRHPVQAWRRS